MVADFLKHLHFIPKFLTVLTSEIKIEYHPLPDMTTPRFQSACSLYSWKDGWYAQEEAIFAALDLN